MCRAQVSAVKSAHVVQAAPPLFPGPFSPWTAENMSPLSNNYCLPCHPQPLAASGLLCVSDFDDLVPRVSGITQCLSFCEWLV